MLVSIWRYAHLALAIVSSVFLLLLSITGVILAVDAVNEKIPPYRVEHIETLNLAQSVTALRKVYPEIIAISIDHNQFVSIDAIRWFDSASLRFQYVPGINRYQLGPISKLVSKINVLKQRGNTEQKSPD